MTLEFVFDYDRARRTGIEEAVLCAGKSERQLAEILAAAEERTVPLLLTRLSADRAAALGERFALDFDDVSGTAYFGDVAAPAGPRRVGVVSAGTSDVPVAREAERTLHYYGIATAEYYDIGVAGLWRLDRHLPELAAHSALIVVAGMDGALFSVLGGLLGNLIVAVPTSAGYGMSRQGESALHAALASCAPGLVVVNIDNGYGAAIAALRAVNAAGSAARE